MGVRTFSLRAARSSRWRPVRVNTVSRRFGISKLTSLRLFSRADQIVALGNVQHRRLRVRPIHGGHPSCGAEVGASRFLIALVTCFATHDAISPSRASRGAGRRWAAYRPVGEASAEGAQRRAADRETDLGDAQGPTTQQRHRPLDAPRHQVAVRRLAVGEPELALRCPADMCAPRASASTSSGCACSGRSSRGRGAAARGRAGPAPRRVCWSPARSCHVAPEVPSAAGVPPHCSSALAGLLP